MSEEYVARLRSDAERLATVALLTVSHQAEHELEDKLRRLSPHARLPGRMEFADDVFAAHPDAEGDEAKLLLSQARVGYLRERHRTALDIARRRVEQSAKRSLGLDRFLPEGPDGHRRFTLSRLAAATQPRGHDPR